MLSLLAAPPVQAASALASAADRPSSKPKPSPTASATPSAKRRPRTSPIWSYSKQNPDEPITLNADGQAIWTCSVCLDKTTSYLLSGGTAAPIRHLNRVHGVQLPPASVKRRTKPRKSSKQSSAPTTSALDPIRNRAAVSKSPPTSKKPPVAPASQALPDQPAKTPRLSSKHSHALAPVTPQAPSATPSLLQPSSVAPDDPAFVTPQSAPDAAAARDKLATPSPPAPVNPAIAAAAVDLFSTYLSSPCLSDPSHQSTSTSLYAFPPSPTTPHVLRPATSCDLYSAYSFMPGAPLPASAYSQISATAPAAAAAASTLPSPPLSTSPSATSLFMEPPTATGTTAIALPLSISTSATSSSSTPASIPVSPMSAAIGPIGLDPTAASAPPTEYTFATSATSGLQQPIATLSYKDILAGSQLPTSSTAFPFASPTAHPRSNPSLYLDLVDVDLSSAGSPDLGASTYSHASCISSDAVLAPAPPHIIVTNPPFFHDPSSSTISDSTFHALANTSTPLILDGSITSPLQPAAACSALGPPFVPVLASTPSSSAAAHDTGGWYYPGFDSPPEDPSTSSSAASYINSVTASPAMQTTTGFSASLFLNDPKISLYEFARLPQFEPQPDQTSILLPEYTPYP